MNDYIKIPNLLDGLPLELSNFIKNSTTHEEIKEYLIQNPEMFRPNKICSRLDDDGI